MESGTVAGETGVGAKRHREEAEGSAGPVVQKKARTTRLGGVYMPPFRLAQLQQQTADKSSAEYQRMTWDALRKSINGLINKVNTSNIMNLLEELFRENIIRGRGLLCRALMKAQQVSPTFTRVFAALIAVVNTKMPQVGELLLARLVVQFRKAYRRNDKTSLVATTVFLAHLVNQQVAGEILALQILALLLERPTDDSVEVAVGFVKECGAALQELSPQGFNGVFERFRAILHEGRITKRVQYIIEALFAVRRKKFVEFPAVIEELDLVDADDQITHEDLTLDAEDLDIEETTNYFHEDPEFLENEAKYEEIKRAILDDYSSEEEEGDDDDDEEESEEDEEEKQQQQQQARMEMEDRTEQEMVHLRTRIYLTIMSSKDFEECAHKLLKQTLKEGDEPVLCNMVLDCCSQERTFMRFYGMLANRFCNIDRAFRDAFEQAFEEQYAVIHRLETNKLRNVAMLFAHLLHSDGIEWRVLEVVHLNEDETTSSSRIFIKILFQELAEFMGLEKLNSRLQEPALQEYFAGLFPKDHPRNTRFAINFFTSIGLGGLTDELRQYRLSMPKRIMQQAIDASSSSDDSSSTDSSDSSDDSSSLSSSDSSSYSSDSSSFSSSSSDSSSSDSVSRSRRRKRRRSPRRSRRADSRSSRDRSVSYSRSPVRRRSSRRSSDRDSRRSSGRSGRSSRNSKERSPSRSPRRSPGRSSRRDRERRSGERARRGSDRRYDDRERSRRSGSRDRRR